MIPKFGILPVLLLGLIPSACEADPRPGEAVQVFDRFQAALIANDRALVRELLTRESRPVVKAMPWRKLATKKALQVIGVEEHHGRYQVAVRDPNEAGRESIYTVVRENSRWRVDLLATTTHNHSYTWNEGPETIVRPEVMETGGIREIRASEASSIR